MSSALSQALANKPSAELRRMLSDAQLEAQRARFEVEVIEDAIAASGRTKAPAPRHKDGPSPQAVRERVLEIVGELGPVPPRPIRSAINDESINVYNALGQLVKEGRLRKREDGTYAIPTSSANGNHPVGSEAGTQA